MKLLVGLAATGAGLLLTAACAARPVQATTAARPAASTTLAAAPAPTTEPAGGICSGFELELAHDVGGEPSPLEAARWFAAHGGVSDVPSDGWLDAGHDEAGALVRSGKLTLEVIQGPDLTWQVVSGTWC